jgi:hypothetical protein
MLKKVPTSIIWKVFERDVSFYRRIKPCRIAICSKWCCCYLEKMFSAKFAYSDRRRLKYVTSFSHKRVSKEHIYIYIVFSVAI